MSIERIALFEVLIINGVSVEISPFRSSTGPLQSSSIAFDDLTLMIAIIKNCPINDGPLYLILIR